MSATGLISHEYLKLELPLLGAKAAKIVEKHSELEPERIPGLGSVYSSPQAELELLLHKEEFVLFPAIEQLEDAAGRGVRMPKVMVESLGGPVRVMENERDRAGQALRRLRQLTDDYTPPDWACTTVQAV